MFKKIYRAYIELFDKKIVNNTSLVVIIAVIIVLVGAIVSKSPHNYKWNILEYKQIQYSNEHIITLDNKQYKIVLQEINN